MMRPFNKHGIALDLDMVSAVVTLSDTELKIYLHGAPANIDVTWDKGEEKHRDKVYSDIVKAWHNPPVDHKG